MKKTTFTNDFHRTSASVKAKTGETVSRKTYLRVVRELCPGGGCTCGVFRGSAFELDPVDSEEARFVVREKDGGTPLVYHAAFDGQAIYGIGSSPEAAYDDALAEAGYPDRDSHETDGNTPFRTAPIDLAYAMDILSNGFDGAPFGLENGTIVRS